MIGSRARVSEVMTGKRPLTLDMVRRVRDGLGISADLLIGHAPRHAGSRRLPQPPRGIRAHLGRHRGLAKMRRAEGHTASLERAGWIALLGLREDRTLTYHCPTRKHNVPSRVSLGQTELEQCRDIRAANRVARLRGVGNIPTTSAKQSRGT